MEQLHYKENQYLTFFILIFGIIQGFIILATIFQWGSKPVPWGVTIIISLLFTLLLFNFYVLKIRVTTTHAIAQFGIGWLKRKVSIANLDLETIEVIRLPWYAGVGYRLSSKGTFLNSKPGPALYIKTKDGSAPFFVGTKNHDAILAILRQLQN